MIEKYLTEIQKQEENYDIQRKIIEFFKINSKPSDLQVHNFAKKNGINEHRFEEMIYELLGSIFSQGRAKKFYGSYDENQLQMGIEVEFEHTDNMLIAERIAKDHLAELPDYYTRLEKMEKEGEQEKNI